MLSYPMAERGYEHPVGLGTLPTHDLLLRTDFWRPCREYDEMMAHLSDGTGSINWLEVGSGNGVFAASLQRQIKIHIPDRTINLTELDRTNSFAQSASQKVLANGEHSPFASDSFDLVTARWVYHWGDNMMPAFLNEASRILKPNGIVFVDTITPFNLSCVEHHGGLQGVQTTVEELPVIYKRPRYSLSMTAYDAPTLRGIAKQSGLEIVTMSLYKNDFPNDCGDEYPECIAFLAQKV